MRNFPKIINLQTELISSIFIQLLVIWHDPPINPPIHLSFVETPPPIMYWDTSTYGWIFTQNSIISIRSRFFQFLVFWHDPTHQPTHPLIQPPIVWGICTNHKSSNRIDLSGLSQDLIFLLFYMTPPINPSTCTPSHMWGEFPQLTNLQTESNYHD